MEKVIQLTVNGLVTGSIIAIAAVGLTLVYGLLKIVNFAHGDYMTFGAYMAFIVDVNLLFDPVVAAVAAVLVTAIFSVVLELGLWRPLRSRGAGLTSLFLVSIGLALALRNGILLFVGGRPRRYTVDVLSSYDLGLFRISQSQITVVVTASVLIILVGLFLARTRVGKAMRAMADNADLASVSGINTDRIVTYTWILAGGLAGLAGLLLGILQGAITPNTGWNLLLPIFAAVVLGGVGSAYGALAGGIVLGLVMEYSTLVVPFSYKFAVAFGVMVLVLLFRPQGILGKARIL